MGLSVSEQRIRNRLSDSVYSYVEFVEFDQKTNIHTENNTRGRNKITTLNVLSENA